MSVILPALHHLYSLVHGNFWALSLPVPGGTEIATRAPGRDDHALDWHCFFCRNVQSLTMMGGLRTRRDACTQGVVRKQHWSMKERKDA